VDELHRRVARFVADHDLLRSGQEVTCLVSGGADSTCLWHVLRALGHDVTAVHVHHGVRGAAADADARHCADVLGAEVITVPPAGTEAQMRALRYGATAGRGVRATGHTATDQVETVLYRIISSGVTRGIRLRRDDGVVRPLLGVLRDETEGYCRRHRLPTRVDETNPDTTRGTIREELLPLLRRIDPRAEANLLALAGERPRLPRTLERRLAELLASRDGTKRADLGGGVRAVREYGVVRLEGAVTWGPWELESDRPGLTVRTRRQGDRLAGRRKKVQDLLVDAKVPLAERDRWPIVAHADEVVSVPGVADAPGWEGVVHVRRRA
jgi:tRNA(Ile)-lysidine synthase